MNLWGIFFTFFLIPGITLVLAGTEIIKEVELKKRKAMLMKGVTYGR